MIKLFQTIQFGPYKDFNIYAVVVYNSCFFHVVVIVAALSGGLLLALIFLITFIILNFNIRHKLHNLIAEQSSAHSHTSMPATPGFLLEELTRRVAPSHLATDSDYSEIRSVMSGTYMGPDYYLQRPDVSSRTQSDYIGPDMLQIN